MCLASWPRQLLLQQGDYLSETREKRGSDLNFFLIDLRLVPEKSAPKEHFKPLFSSGTSDPAKIRPLKI